MPKSILELQKKYLDALGQLSYPEQPNNLYEPVKYLLELGGKRIRPVLVLAGADMFDGDLDRAMNMSHAVEFFHNFSLMHDDIMDDADLRRGSQTVHTKYDVNTAILSGDVMLIYAYQFIEQYEPEVLSQLFTLFNKTSVQICEGQQLDVDFETREEVAIDDYLKMITYKTAVLLGASLQFGGIVSGASKKDQEHLYNFGKNIGIAFQVQDDILDVFAESQASGKKKAGDILQKKKTYLYLKSLEILSESQSERLRYLFSDQKEVEGQSLIDETLALFKDCHVKVYAQELKESYQQLGLSHLQMIARPEEHKEILLNFAENLLNRES